MGQVLHRGATTTEAIRQAIQNSQASLRVRTGRATLVFPIAPQCALIHTCIAKQLTASWRS